MPDLCVDGRLLSRTVDCLTALRHEFDALTGRQDASRNDWGSNDIAEAMEDFVDNWDNNRRRISGALGATASMAQSCLTEFAAVDTRLVARPGQ